MSPWEKLLERPHPGGHFVQLYGDDAALIANVGHYLWHGLRRGEGVLVVSTGEHREMFSQELQNLGVDVAAAIRDEQLVLLDAESTLEEFMRGGQPDWRALERTVGAAMRRVRSEPAVEGLRAYGEMVGILWKKRQFAAAIRLEQLWNKLLEQSSFSLYCAYEVDIFGKDADIANLDGILCTHTHLVPGDMDGALEGALHSAMDEILGPKANELRALIKSSWARGSAVKPAAESIVLWLRENRPQLAGPILERARLHYRDLAA